MLELRNIRKVYPSGSGRVDALKGIDLAFREHEFVAVLGPSGCGKTTLLNIIGGLDRYSDGDLIINGRSTRQYRDRDWDAYRNHAVGFVFQSYNLIPHQNVLQNVELSLTLSGVSRAERRRRAAKALEEVGLGDQLHKKPNQMSGGQMQRVAIARALVNDPQILLADEPTGALDSETSIQVMELLKEVARDRLVIMVTHNPELAEAYATRIIRVKDGLVTGDTRPVIPGELPPPGPDPRRTRLGFSTALGLSLKNLMTKKGRTILTSFAGAIGIIGIALILALSNGVNDYITDLEHDMLGVYPIRLEQQAFDLAGMMAEAESAPVIPEEEEHDLDAVYSRNIVGDSVTATESMVKENDLGLFKAYLEKEGTPLASHISAIEYGYDITPQVFRMEGEEVVQVSPSRLETEDGTVGGGTSTAWSQLVSDQTLRESQYELVEGQWPSAHDQAALVVNSRNEISDYNLYTLGLMDLDRMEAIVEAAREGKDYQDPQEHFSYADIIGRTYQVFAPCQLFAKGDKVGVWIDKTKDEDHWKEIFEDGLTVTITCVLRATEDADISSGVAYDGRLTQHLMAFTAESQAVKDQLADPRTNILTGEPFEEEEEEEPKAEETAAVSRTASVSTLRADQPYTLSLLTVTETPPPEEAPPAEEEVPPQEEGPPAEEDPETPPEEEPPPEETPTLFTVKFANYDGGLLAPDTQYEAGAPITVLPQQNPVRAPTAAAYYVFIGWWSSAQQTFYRTAELPPVTGDVTYTAVYYEQLLPGGQGDPSGWPGLGGIDWGALSGSISAGLSQDQLSVMMAQMSDRTPDTYEEVLETLGYITPDTPEEIAIYPMDFDGKETVETFIQTYNDQTERKEDQVTYTDIIGALTASITSIVDTISYVLIAFVAISLVVSSIMIAIITYISVLERTREIGVLRALGASKGDVSKIFNAETVIEGFLSGLFGIGVTLLLCIPINAIVNVLVEVETIAVLPMEYSLILIAISVGLTLIAGFIPARMAAQKDPVTALRTE